MGGQLGGEHLIYWAPCVKFWFDTFLVKWNMKDVSLRVKGKNRTCLRSGLRSDWSGKFDSGNSKQWLFSSVLFYLNFTEVTQKTVVKSFVMSISFCQLSDNLFKFLWKLRHEVGWVHVAFLFLWPILCLLVQK